MRFQTPVIISKSTPGSWTLRRRFIRFDAPPMVQLLATGIASQARCLSFILLVHSHVISSYQFLFPDMSFVIQSTISPVPVRLSSATAGL
jgi:hypothetical protein